MAGIRKYAYMTYVWIICAAQCIICNKTFSQAANLSAHLRIHSGILYILTVLYRMQAGTPLSTTFALTRVLCSARDQFTVYGTLARQNELSSVEFSSWIVRCCAVQARSRSSATCATASSRSRRASRRTCERTRVRCEWTHAVLYCSVLCTVHVLLVYSTVNECNATNTNVQAIGRTTAPCAASRSPTRRRSRSTCACTLATSPTRYSTVQYVSSRVLPAAPRCPPASRDEPSAALRIEHPGISLRAVQDLLDALLAERQPQPPHEGAPHRRPLPALRRARSLSLRTTGRRSSLEHRNSSLYYANTCTWCPLHAFT